MNLITGATGLVGTHLALELLKKGEAVKALRRSSSDTTHMEQVFRFYHPSYQQLFEKIQWIEGDLNDINCLEDAVLGCDTVFHCAALVSFLKKDEEKMRRVNIEGTENLVNICLTNPIKYFCFVSSIAALGRTGGNAKISEKTEWKTSPHNTAYAISKYAAEQEVWRGQAEGLRVGIVNPGVIVGPGDFSRSSGEMFERVAGGLPFYPTGSNGFVDVRDVAKTCVQLATEDRAGDRFILVGENASYKYLLGKIAKKLDKKAPPRPAKPWMLAIGWRVLGLLSKITGKPPAVTKDSAKSSQVQHSYDSSHATQVLGVDFIPLADAVENAGNYYLAHY